ncbi:acetylornithine deacetylase [Marinicella sp. W31]|uniref:acetylornithine deacetylase n=1 Tax=Marinicella sp. W31 TaxID=3023713 RepID=UPI003757D887
MQDKILAWLEFLIAQDTQNPPRTISADDALFQTLQKHLIEYGFSVELLDYGNGSVCLYAHRGQHTVLFNVHLDTVPVNSGWSYDPFTLTVVDDRVYGRGCCDIKGAAACLMALSETDTDLSLLFSTDEEGTESCCIQHFLDTHDLSAYQQVIVAEPTQCQAALSHRGYLSAHGVFDGISGHSSNPAALTHNAIHKAHQWLQQALVFAGNCVTTENPAGVAFNLGYFEGGTKNNMIAEQARLGFSTRVPGGGCSQQLYAQLTALDGAAQWHYSMSAPALPASGQDSHQSLSFCQQHQIDTVASVDFWTEAALFSQAGMAAIVLGPGDIAQAHTTDEWVSQEQLDQCYQIYRRISDAT